LAPLYLARATLLATVAYEQQHPDPGQQARPGEGDSDEYSVWCRRYLATDPEHAVTAALHVARLALQQAPARSKQSELRVIEATALCYLGRHQEEVAALRQAKRFATNPSAVVAHLIRAYGEAGQLPQEQAALRVWHQRPQPIPPLPMPPPLRAFGITRTPMAASDPSESVWPFTIR
jgi:hypothetical protein